MHDRRHFITLLGATLAPLSLRGAEKDAAAKLRWTDATAMHLEGRGWEGQERLRHYDRLPAKAEKTVRKVVWDLSRHSTGMAVRFRTDAREIHVRYSLMSSRLAMPHMPATSVSGIDLYARDAKGTWRWVAVTKPAAQTVNARLIEGMEPGEREYMAYLPLYNGVEKLEIGVPSAARFTALPAREKPVVFYGTSITHGASASRPGMTHVAILGRRLDRPVMNLGFSGNGRMEMEIADLMTELDPAVFVIDCLPNIARAREVTERTEPLVRRLRAARPDTPIILIEDRSYAHSWVHERSRRRSELTRAALRATYDKLVASGVKHLHYLEGGNLLGSDGDATTDGSHPNDLGFTRQADAIEPVLRKALS
ncbi:SGNH/GDSL hydrolase family protein [Luteolibacter flavescens]|uniref:SGNH/GDSL hydrolase family protein n=1 Tax=Luteolibacter flavescens TaxID=1859460 RepID=A0ABT3FJX9_9BACT|nr:SGNH/GDSL hydrolase family protein [Luteolibacter flavescens]MCW1883873.1 SGNH/GDSL hydrolase family protein [Luteolibacter flavescens]